jgi:hypothetical protein
MNLQRLGHQEAPGLQESNLYREPNGIGKQMTESSNGHYGGG